jgi:hypothetical protein
MIYELRTNTSKVNFRAQRIDDSVQICYMAETLFFVKFSSCSLLRGLKCESWKNLKQLSKMEQFSSVIYSFRGNIITIDSLQGTESKVAGLI